MRRTDEGSTLMFVRLHYASSEKEEGLVLSFTIHGGCLVKLQRAGFQGAPGFKGHLDAESWTVVHKQHSDMCSEHPISWNTNRARAIWRTGDQFEKCEQLKHIFTVWSNSIASWNAQENTWKKTKGYVNAKVYLYKATLQYTEHTEKFNTENRVQWGTKEQPVILYWPIIVFLLRLFTHCD